MLCTRAPSMIKEIISAFVKVRLEFIRTLF